MLLLDVVGNFMKVLLDCYGYARITPEFWVRQREFAVRCLFKYCGEKRRRGVAQPRDRSGFHVHGSESQLQFTHPEEPDGPGNLVTARDKKVNEASAFYRAVIEGCDVE